MPAIGNNGYEYPVLGWCSLEQALKWIAFKEWPVARRHWPHFSHHDMDVGDHYFEDAFEKLMSCAADGLISLRGERLLNRSLESIKIVEGRPSIEVAERTGTVEELPTEHLYPRAISDGSNIVWAKTMNTKEDCWCAYYHVHVCTPELLAVYPPSDGALVRYDGKPSPATQASPLECHFSLTLPEGADFLSIREIPYLTVDAIYPKAPETAQDAQLVYDLLKVDPDTDSIPAKPGQSLDNKDWATLEVIWAAADLSPAKFPLPVGEWGKYQSAFEMARHKPNWLLVPMVRREDMIRGLARIGLLAEHQKRLQQAIKRGALRPVHPLTFLPQNLTVDDAGDDSCLPVAQFVQFAAELSISVTVGRGDCSARDDKKTRSATSRDRDDYKEWFAARLACGETPTKAESRSWAMSRNIDRDNGPRWLEEFFPEHAKGPGRPRKQPRPD